MEDLPFFLPKNRERHTSWWGGGGEIEKGVYTYQGRGVQIQIKTPKYMQKQAEIDLNRDIFAYICTAVAVNRDIYRDMGLY